MKETKSNHFGNSIIGEMLEEPLNPFTINLIYIDCGIGTISYIEPDNLKLQQFMEWVKEKIEKDGIESFGAI